MLSTLRLFKALPIEDENKTYVNEALYAKTLPLGFVFSSEVVGNYPDTERLLKMVDDLYGRDPEQLNKSFHKSFAKVRDASLTQLWYEQAIHYMTTYGAEAFGVFSNDSVYIPAEQLDIPEITSDIKLVVIRGLTKVQLKEKIVALLASGVALSEQSVKDATDIAAFVGFNAEDIDKVQNREVRTALYDYFGLVPAAPVEFLRYVVQKVTGGTLLIKNPALVEQLKIGVQAHNLLPLFMRYENETGLARLGEIFNRYKPLFLALRADKKLRPVVNKIRRLATTNHKPLAEDYLNNVTALLGRNQLEVIPFLNELKKVNVFRKVRLAQALKVRIDPTDSVLYRVRNGKSFAKSFKFNTKQDVGAAYDLVISSIVNDIKPALEGKSVYIPTGVVYGLPSSEKQFTGNLPSGTYVDIPGDIVAGIYWEDQNGRRIDLDLSLINAEGKFGWDGSYRNRGSQIYFSGDNTSAPKGASEVFHIGQNARGAWMLNVNYFNFDPALPVPFKIVVGSEDVKKINQNYVIDPNHLLAASSTVIDVKQKNLGLIVANDDIRRFYFLESNMGGGISARQTAHAEKARKFLNHSLLNMPTLNEVLLQAGANFVSTPEEADIDLSPEAVDKTTLLELLYT